MCLFLSLAWPAFRKSKLSIVKGRPSYSRDGNLIWLDTLHQTRNSGLDKSVPKWKIITFKKLDTLVVFVEYVWWALVQLYIDMGFSFSFSTCTAGVSGFSELIPYRDSCLRLPGSWYNSKYRWMVANLFTMIASSFILNIYQNPIWWHFLNKFSC